MSASPGARGSTNGGPADEPGGVDALVLRPDPREWQRLAQLHYASIADEARAFRRDLGLPTDRPVVMSGHQAQVWHPGILAKWLAMQAIAARVPAAAAWLVVDQDDNDPFELMYPARLGGRLRREKAGADALVGTPTGLRPARADAAAAVRNLIAATEPAANGLARIGDALQRHAGQIGAARQVAMAVRDLAEPRSDGPQLVYASDLARGVLFGQLVATMQQDPARCAEAYNHAIAVSEDAGVGMLATTDARRGPELPLWRLRHVSRGGATMGVRDRVHAQQLAEIPRAELAPRALLMTAVLRLGACDLFIHGTGGGGDGDTGEGYDRVMERWIRGWLGPDAADRLAPMATVTATLRLDLGSRPIQPLDAAAVRWRAHHARHDPSMLGDVEAAAGKRQLVDRIKLMRRKGNHPREEFAKLQDLLAGYRQRHSAQLDSLRAQAAGAQARLAEAEVLDERTWPFPLYPEPQLRALRDAIGARFSR